MFCILIYLNISCDLKHHTENLLRFRHPKSSIRHPESWIKRHYSWDLIIILILYNNCECTHSSGGTLSREAVCRLHCCVSRRCSFRCHSLPLQPFLIIWGRTQTDHIILWTFKHTITVKPMHEWGEKVQRCIPIEISNGVMHGR